VSVAPSRGARLVVPQPSAPSRAPGQHALLPMVQCVVGTHARGRGGRDGGERERTASGQWSSAGGARGRVAVGARRAAPATRASLAPLSPLHPHGGLPGYAPGAGQAGMRSLRAPRTAPRFGLGRGGDSRPSFFFLTPSSLPATAPPRQVLLGVQQKVPDVRQPELNTHVARLSLCVPPER